MEKFFAICALCFTTISSAGWIQAPPPDNFKELWEWREKNLSCIVGLSESGNTIRFHQVETIDPKATIPGSKTLLVIRLPDGRLLQRMTKIGEIHADTIKLKWYLEEARFDNGSTETTRELSLSSLVNNPCTDRLDSLPSIFLRERLKTFLGL
ncbi:MAG: hypothetical protein AAB507_00120 [Patescibacteria group bacterium]